MFGLEKIFRKFPIRVVVAARRGGTPMIFEDRASRITEKDDIEYHLLKKENAKIRPIPFSAMYPGAKGRTYAFLLSPEKGSYFPMTIDNPGELKVSSKEMDTWFLLQTQIANMRFPKEKSFLEKYASFIILGFTATIMLIIVLFSMNALASVAGTAAGISSQLTEIAQMISNWNPIPPGT